MFAAGIVSIGHRLAWRFFGGFGERNWYVRDLLLGLVSPAQVALPIAPGTFAAMYLPISTPPNALDIASGHCETRNLLLSGALVNLLASLVAVLWSSRVLNLLLTRG